MIREQEGFRRSAKIIGITPALTGGRTTTPHFLEEGKDPTEVKLGRRKRVSLSRNQFHQDELIYEEKRRGEWEVVYVERDDSINNEKAPWRRKLTWEPDPWTPGH